MSMTWEGKSYHSFVRLTSWSKENDIGDKKSNDKGKKEQNNRAGKKIILSPIGVWNLECIGTHCWRSVWGQGRFYLHFKLSPIYDRDWSQGLRESPAISVLIVCRIQHTQVGSVRMVLSVAFPLFMDDSPSFLQKNDVLKNSTTFWFSEREDDKNTWCLCRHLSKTKWSIWKVRFADSFT
jgi:hypothetical protein